MVAAVMTYSTLRTQHKCYCILGNARWMNSTIISNRKTPVIEVIFSTICTQKKSLGHSNCVNETQQEVYSYQCLLEKNFKLKGPRFFEWYTSRVLRTASPKAFIIGIRVNLSFSASCPLACFSSAEINVLFGNFSNKLQFCHKTCSYK